MRSICFRSVSIRCSMLMTITALAALAGGCGGDDPEGNPGTGGSGAGSGSGGNGGGTGGVEPPKGMAMIRVVHASPDAPAVDVYAAGVPDALIANLAYGSTSEYLTVPKGDYDLAVRVSPSTDGDAAVYETGSITLDDGAVITAVAAGLVGSTEDARKFRVLTLEEDFGAAGADSAIVRVVHVSPDAPSVGIDMHDDDASSPEITGLDRFTDSGEAGFPLSAGQALQLGIAAGGSKVTAFTTPELPAGAQLFVIATGLVGKLAREQDGFALLAVGPEGSIGFIKQNPLVYALHAGPNAPAVDAYAGDAELIDDLAFGDLAGPLQVPPGDYTLDFYAHEAGSTKPAGAAAASAKTGQLEAGERYLSIATGFLGGGNADAFRLISLPERFDLDKQDNALLRIVHGCPDAPTVDLGILNAENVVAPVLVPGVSFGDATEGPGMSAGIGTLPIGVTPAGANDQVVASFHVTTAANLRAFAIASGSLGGKGEHFQLLVVDTASTPWSVGSIDPQPQQ
jgi:hypothetical protein